MGAQIRVYRQKIASTSSMKKIFKAMEMIATSRINKARNAAQAAGIRERSDPRGDCGCNSARY